MTITITILNIVQATPDNLPASQTATFAIQNDAISQTWYRWSMGGIASGADVQAALNANAPSLYAEASANGVTIGAGYTRPIDMATITNDKPINGLVTGPQLIAVIPGSLAYYAPVRYRVVVLPGVTGTGTPPTASLGTNGPNYNNIASAVALGSIGLTGALNMRNVMLTTTLSVIDSDLSVFCNITVAAIGYTAFPIRIDMIFDRQTK